jgi:hypothetical protein
MYEIDMKNLLEQNYDWSGKLKIIHEFYETPAVKKLKENKDLLGFKDSLQSIYPHLETDIDLLLFYYSILNPMNKYRDMMLSSLELYGLGNVLYHFEMLEYTLTATMLATFDIVKGDGIVFRASFEGWDIRRIQEELLKINENNNSQF